MQKLLIDVQDRIVQSREYKSFRIGNYSFSIILSYLGSSQYVSENQSLQSCVLQLNEGEHNHIMHLELVSSYQNRWLLKTFMAQECTKVNCS